VANGDAQLTAAHLLDVADHLMRTAERGTHGVWPRVVGFLLRLALEMAIDEYWAGTAPEMPQSPRRTQLVCLRAFVGPTLAGRVHQVWGSLSTACHYYQYDFAPTAAELRAWHVDVTDLSATLECSRLPAGVGPI
jgi:hypothetical protein